MNNVIPTEDETWAAAAVIMKATAVNSPLRQSLNIIRYNGHHLSKLIKSIKSASSESEIVLRGKWLQQKGFTPENKIWVLPFSELLIVIPQAA